IGSTFSSLSDFMSRIDPANPSYNPLDFNSYVTPALGTPYKGEDISIGQLGFYVQDEYPASDRLNLTYGLRADFPLYFTDPVDNPSSRLLTALDANGNPETV